MEAQESTSTRWLQALPVDELQLNQKRMVRLNGKAILLINCDEGIFAMDNACPHWGFPLNAGKLSDDCTLTCPFHRSAFDIRTGDVKEWSPWPPAFGPMLRGIRRKNVLPVYETKLSDGLIWVKLEE
ncbi:MAG: Rieske (2Fe-2S) protein [Chloroflexi bacterium]|nr:MAG: Rieske (2Fe-2S) protein [Chloroflexota bacterium]MBL1196423.1 Rieske (2Fe-2S) protein [Chloroflexota bacterium]NOH13718.1 Rieske (2Fe-2S) protein [Chloroflexota bacterium]